MLMKILVFYLSALLLMQVVQSKPKSEVNSSKTTVVVSFDNIVIKILEVLHTLGSSLPVGKSDDIFIITNVDDPVTKHTIEDAEERYNDLNQFATKKEGNYNFFADLHNFCTELYKAKATFENNGGVANSTDYQNLQDNYKLELLKLVERFLNDMFNMLASNWKSFTDVTRIGLQTIFYNKLEEIKIGTDIEEKYLAFHKLITTTYEEIRSGSN